MVATTLTGLLLYLDWLLMRYQMPSSIQLVIRWTGFGVIPYSFQPCGEDDAIYAMNVTFQIESNL